MPRSLRSAEMSATTLVHGAGSELLTSTVAEEVAEYLFAEAPWVLEMDFIAIDQYCRTEARLRLLTTWMEEIVAEKGPEKVPSYLWGEITRAETNAYRRADSLGLSPEGRMKIAKDSGLAQHFSQNGVADLKKQGAALRSAK